MAMPHTGSKRKQKAIVFIICLELNAGEGGEGWQPKLLLRANVILDGKKCLALLCSIVLRSEIDFLWSFCQVIQSHRERRNI